MTLRTLVPLVIGLALAALTVSLAVADEFGIRRAHRKMRDK